VQKWPSKLDDGAKLQAVAGADCIMSKKNHNAGSDAGPLRAFLATSPLVVTKEFSR
jgi:hypothetical protein